MGDAEFLCNKAVSDTTVGGRRDEWIAAGVFDAISNEAIEGYDRFVGLGFAGVALDGSPHKSPCGGERTGPNPTARGKLGWKWSLVVDTRGIPLGCQIAGASRNDSVLFEPTIDDLGGRGMLGEIETIGSIGALTANS